MLCFVFGFCYFEIDRLVKLHLVGKGYAPPATATVITATTPHQQLSNTHIHTRMVAPIHADVMFKTQTLKTERITLIVLLCSFVSFSNHFSPSSPVPHPTLSPNIAWSRERHRIVCLCDDAIISTSDKVSWRWCLFVRSCVARPPHPATHVRTHTHTRAHVWSHRFLRSWCFPVNP